MEVQVDRSMCDSAETVLFFSLNVQRGVEGGGGIVCMCVNDNTNLRRIYDPRK